MLTKKAPREPIAGSVDAVQVVAPTDSSELTAASASTASVDLIATAPAPSPASAPAPAPGAVIAASPAPAPLSVSVEEPADYEPRDAHHEATELAAEDEAREIEVEVPAGEESMPPPRAWEPSAPGQALSRVAFGLLQELLRDADEESARRENILGTLAEVGARASASSWPKALEWADRHSKRWSEECVAAVNVLRAEAERVRKGGKPIPGIAAVPERLPPPPAVVNPSTSASSLAEGSPPVGPTEEEAAAIAKAMEEAALLALQIEELEREHAKLLANAEARDAAARAMKEAIAAAVAETAAAKAEVRTAELRIAEAEEAESSAATRVAAERAAARASAAQKNEKEEAARLVTEAKKREEEAAEAAAAKLAAEARAATALDRRAQLEKIRDRLKAVLSAQQEAFGGVGASAMRRFKMQVATGRTKVEVVRQQREKMLTEITEMNAEISSLNDKLKAAKEALKPPPKAKEGDSEGGSGWSKCKALNDSFDELEEPRKRVQQLERQLQWWRMRWVTRFGEQKSGKSLAEMNADDLMSSLQETAANAASAPPPQPVEALVEEDARPAAQAVDDDYGGDIFTMKVDDSFLTNLGFGTIQGGNYAHAEAANGQADGQESSSLMSMHEEAGRTEPVLLPAQPPQTKASKMLALQRASLLARLAASGHAGGDDANESGAEEDQAALGEMPKRPTPKPPPNLGVGATPTDPSLLRRSSCGGAATAIMMANCGRPPKRRASFVDPRTSEPTGDLEDLLGGTLGGSTPSGTPVGRRGSTTQIRTEQRRASSRSLRASMEPTEDGSPPPSLRRGTEAGPSVDEEVISPSSSFRGGTNAGPSVEEEPDLAPSPPAPPRTPRSIFGRVPATLRPLSEALLEATEATAELQIIARSLLPEGWEGEWEAERRDVPSLAYSRFLSPGKMAAGADEQAAFNLESKLREFFKMSQLMQQALAIGPVDMMPSSPLPSRPPTSPLSPLPGSDALAGSQRTQLRPQTSGSVEMSTHTLRPYPPSVPPPSPDASARAGPFSHRRTLRDPTGPRLMLGMDDKAKQAQLHAKRLEQQQQSSAAAAAAASRPTAVAFGRRMSPTRPTQEPPPVAIRAASVLEPAAHAAPSRTKLARTPSRAAAAAAPPPRPKVAAARPKVNAFEELRRAVPPNSPNTTPSASHPGCSSLAWPPTIS